MIAMTKTRSSSAADSYRPERNFFIVMGDFNAKTDSDNRDHEEIMGQQGLSEMNDNEERFADLCATSNLVI